MQAIDLENSFSFIGENNDFSRRSITSTLYDFEKKKYFFMNKECLSERIQHKIFHLPFISEFQTITSSENEIFEFRTSSINFDEARYNFRKKNFLTTNSGGFTNKIIFTEYKEISLDSIYNDLKKQDHESIYSYIEYYLNEKKFSTFFRCDYINLKSKKFCLQPIHGKIPIIIYNEILLSYLSAHIDESKKQTVDLEIVFGNYDQVFYIKKNSQFVKNLIKKFLNLIFPYVYNYNKHVVLPNSKIKFYRKVK